MQQLLEADPTWIAAGPEYQAGSRRSNVATPKRADSAARRWRRKGISLPRRRAGLTNELQQEGEVEFGASRIQRKVARVLGGTAVFKTA